MKTCNTCISCVDGHCYSNKLADDCSQSAEESKDMLLYGHAESGAFIVGPDFGCVHHKERNPSAVDPHERTRGGRSCDVMRKILTPLQMTEDEQRLELLFHYAIASSDDPYLAGLSLAKPFMNEMKPGYEDRFTKHVFEGFKLAIRNLGYVNATKLNGV